MVEVRFFKPQVRSDINFIYSIIVARYGSKWIFVRNHKRTTWEIPGGHIEKEETPDQAAKRELVEETGAIDFRIECVANYSVLKDGHKGYGRLYFAEIFTLGPLLDTTEIGEIRTAESLPDNLTHPDVQPQLFEKVVEFLGKKA